MTEQDFQELTGKGIVFLDGAMGTNLYRMGMPHGCCTEAWVLKHPEDVERLQRAYVEAGSQIIYAPTFGANRSRLTIFDLGDQVDAMNRKLVEISKRAASGKAWIAGDISPTNMILEENGGDGSREEMFEVYRQQAQALYDAGCDLFAVESMLAVQDAVIAVEAVKSVCSCPVICTLTVRRDGSAYYGGDVFSGGPLAERAGASAYGINCCYGPDGLEQIVSVVAENVHVPVVAKPNAGLPHKDASGQLCYSFTPDQFARHLQGLVSAGARIVGGCCGTTPEYIRKLSEELHTRQK
ncbi:MAG: homocysteine S-methyltransferase family protein [Eubacterium sp.]|nr:homocysteine S-methyltransferase family protein [Eubacterium sp.]